MNCYFCKSKLFIFDSLVDYCVNCPLIEREGDGKFAKKFRIERLSVASQISLYSLGWNDDSLKIRLNIYPILNRFQLMELFSDKKIYISDTLLNHENYSPEELKNKIIRIMSLI